MPPDNTTITTTRKKLRPPTTTVAPTTTVRVPTTHASVAAVTSPGYVKITDGRMFDWSFFLFQV